MSHASPIQICTIASGFNCRKRKEMVLQSTGMFGVLVINFTCIECYFIKVSKSSFPAFIGRFFQNVSTGEKICIYLASDPKSKGKSWDPEIIRKKTPSMQSKCRLSERGFRQTEIAVVIKISGKFSLDILYSSLSVLFFCILSWRAHIVYLSPWILKWIKCKSVVYVIKISGKFSLDILYNSLSVLATILPWYQYRCALGYYFLMFSWIFEISAW